MSETASTTSDAERIRAAVLATDGVAELHSGAFGEIATYLPGGRVAGIRVDRSDIEVHIVVYLEADIRDVAENVRGAAQALFPDRRPCTVVVEDVVTGMPSGDQSNTGDQSLTGEVPSGEVPSQETRKS